MSGLNRLRAQIKKRMVRSSGDSNSSSVGANSMLGPPSKESKAHRKALSVSSPPDVSTSPVHTVRKKSLSTESPSHMKQTPTSPLVNTKISPLVSLSGSQQDNAYSVTNGSAATTSRSSTPILALPKLSVNSVGEDQHRQGIIDITVNVQSFLAAISKLKKAMEESDGPKEEEAPIQGPGSPSHSVSSSSEYPDVIIGHVTNLIQVVQTCLNEHGSMQSTAIKDAAKELLNTYRDCDHTNAATCSVCNGAIETLIDAFTDSVSEYLTGESAQSDYSAKEAGSSGGQQQRKGLERAGLKGFSKSQDNLMSNKFTSYIDLSQQFSEPITDDIDQALFSIENSTDVAARYIKQRVKYHKEVASYLNKRSQIEANYMKQMTNLGTKTLRVLQEMDHPLPLMDVFRRSIEGDIRNAASSNTTYNQQVASKFVEPLEHKINDCERRRKELSSTWRNEKKKLIEAKTAMKSAMSRYRFLGDDLSRVKNLLAMDPYGKQAEKRKKELSDIETKWQEAEQTYKNSVAECNDCQYQVHIAAQRSILCAYRRMVIDLDIQLQSGLEAYYILQQNFFTTLPEPLVQYLDDVRDYNIGSEFMDYVHQHPRQREEPEDYLFEEYDPEAEETTENYMADVSSIGGAGGGGGASTGTGGGARIPTSASADSSTFLNQGAEEGPDQAPSPNPFQDPPFHHSTMAVVGDNTSSPRAAKKRPTSEILESDPFKNPLIRRNSDQASNKATKDTLSPPTTTPQQPVAPGVVPFSKMALTHTFKKLRGPARCRECDTYVYFHGHECEICGLACHKKCLETLAIRCGNKRLARKMNTFGVDFHKHLKATKRYIPIIVTKCIEEIDARALDTRGLYRISSAKTKLEHLCQLFESGADRVDLSDRPSHLIGSCLKLYFRQLPEPLLTFGLYHEFITFARECSYILPCNLESVTGEKRETACEMLDRLNGLLQKLPYENYITLAKLLYHLNMVSHPDHVKHNFMPPSNLGIVFGPNLLRQREQVASLALLADMTAQAKAIEIMISHVNELFHMTEDKLKEVEHEYDDESDFTKEVNVDEPTESIKSPQLELEDVTTVGSHTPYNTPPERRRENVFELGEVLEVLQSVGRRNSESLLKPPHPRMSDVKDQNVSTSLPSFSTPSLPSSSLSSISLPACVGSEDSTLTTLSKYLRSSSIVNTPAMEKMLTPVAEHEPNPFSDEEEDDDLDTTIVCSSSKKIDGSDDASRPCSSLSNPGGGGVVTWTLDSDVSSMKDNVSILSGGEMQSAKVSILSGGGGDGETDISSRKESLQSSDEDSHLLVRTILGETPTSPDNSELPQSSSATSGSAKRTSDVFIESSSSSPRFHPYQKRNSLRSDNYSGSQCSSPLSPTSHMTISSQSSCSEVMGEDEVKLRKYSVSEKYARHEAYRASLALSSSGSSSSQAARDKDTFEGEPVEFSQSSAEDGGGGIRGEPVEFSQCSTQDSSATLTEERLLSAVEDVDAGSKREDGGGTEYRRGRNEVGGVISEVSDHRILEIRDSLKHCDSGIDETPEANKTFKDGVRRLSMPPSGDDSHAMADVKPLSYTSAFASRESGLADSPDPEMLIDDAIPHKSQRALHAQASENTRAEQKDSVTTIESAEIEIFVPQGEKSVSPEAEDTISEGGRRIRTRSEKLSSSYSLERASVAPRSLDNPTFSRYARTPIRDSKMLKATDVPQGLRYRSVSMDKIPTTFDPDEKSVETRAYSMSTSKSVMLSPYFSPVHHPAPASHTPAKNSHPNQRFCVNKKDTPPSTPTTPSSTTSHSNLHDDIAVASSASPYGSPVIGAKHKKGKGIKERLKPALRVLKINNSSPSPILRDPPQEVDEQLEHQDNVPSGDSGAESAHSSSQSSPKETGDDDGTTSPCSNVIGQSRKVRMMSPEAVATRSFIPDTSSLRRSQSSEDILESGTREAKELECDSAMAKFGSLVVIPEPKHKSRGKFLEKLKGKRRGTGSRDESSPALLARGHHSVSTDALQLSLSSEGGTRSPKHKKRHHRTPHFV